MPKRQRSDQPSSLLLDTHVLIWLVEGEQSLGQRARLAVDEQAKRESVWVSAITPREIGLLINKKRLRLGLDALTWVTKAIHLPGVRLADLAPEIAVGSTQLPFEIHPDPADRILVATARYLGATLVTADQRLLELAAKGNFKAMDATR